VLSQVLGIAVMSIYFMSVLVSSRLSLNRWMDLYSTFAFFLAVIGLVLFVVKHLLGNAERLASLYSEPSIYISCTLPAIGYYANQYLSRRIFGFELAVLVLSYGLADSAAGFLGLLLVAIFAFKDRVAFWQILLAPFVLALACVGLYFASGNVQLRVNDTVRAIMTLDLAKTNGSTYAMLSNLYGAYRAFIDYPVFGVGIGGYQYVYERYVGTTLRTDTVTFGLNMYDANSLYFRVPAELGIFGLVSLLGFLFVCARVRGDGHLLLRNALLPYLLERFYHSGAYFTTELYFFGGMYLLNYLDYRSGRAGGTSFPILPVRNPSVPDARNKYTGSHSQKSIDR
jgi:O-antigen ligase